MTARTVPQLNVTSALYISPTLPAAYDAVSYQDTDLAFTQIKKVENFGEHGVDRQITTFIPVETGVIQKLSGSKDYGQKSLSLGYVPGDAGQALLKAASEANVPYSFRMNYAAGVGESVGEVHFIEAIVKSFRVSDGDANSVRKVTAVLELTQAPVVVAAT